MTKEIIEDKSMSAFKNKTRKDLDFCISASDNVDVTLTEQESIDLLALLERGPNIKAQNFAKESKDFYEKNRKKVQLYLEQNNIK